eukprot:759143-Pleurochrysis_carterae.AAC.1
MPPLAPAACRGTAISGPKGGPPAHAAPPRPCAGRRTGVPAALHRLPSAVVVLEVAPPRPPRSP